jgi:uncharacterized membrane protein
MRAPAVTTAVVAASVCALAVALAADAPPAVRGPLALWFLLACPGLALVPLLRLADPVARWTLIVSLSVALDLAVTLIMMYAGWWSSPAIFAVLAAISLAGGVAQLLANGERAG